MKKAMAQMIEANEALSKTWEMFTEEERDAILDRVIDITRRAADELDKLIESITMIADMAVRMSREGGKGVKSIYISGPYTAADREGEDENIKAAAAMASIYLHAGWAVFCPHTMTAVIDREFNEDGCLTYDDWLTLDLYWLAKCDAIHMLPGWHHSRGAKMEYLVARALGLEIRGEPS